MVIPPPQIFPHYRDIVDYRGNIPPAAFLIYTDRGKIGMVEDVMGTLKHAKFDPDRQKRV